MPISLKILVLIALAAIFYALGSGLFYLMRDGGQSPKVIKALFWRLVISIVLFALLLFAVLMHWLVPHGLTL